jgi:hypothetical protein
MLIKKYIVVLVITTFCKVCIAQQFSKVEDYHSNFAYNATCILKNGNLFVNGIVKDTLSPYKNLNVFAHLDTSTGDYIYCNRFSGSPNHINVQEHCFIELPGNRFAAGGGYNLNARNILMIYDSLGVVIDYNIFDDTTAFGFYPKFLLYRDSAIYFLLNRTEPITLDVNLYLVKFDLDLNIIWRRTYGLTNLSEQPGSMLNLDTCIWVGANRSTLNHVPYTIEETSRTWLFTVDTAGNMIDEWLDPDLRTYWPDKMIKAPGNKVILVGGYRDDPVWNDNYEVWWKGYAACFDLNTWTKTWWKKYGNLTPTTYFHDIDSVNGGYLLTGADAVDTPVAFIPPGGWLAKIDMNGNMIWESKYLPFVSGTSNSALRETVFLPSGDMISVGWADNGQFYGWVLRTDSVGCLLPNCSHVGIEDEENLISLKVYPNPSSNIINFQFEPDENIHLEIYDLLGKQIFAREIQNSTQINVETWPKGIYLYQLNTKGVLRGSGKFIVE